MKQLVIGTLAHVDAGKTTLNESFLYHGGVIRKIGRVDHKDTYLDYDSLEKDHGITIYSKVAQFLWKDSSITIVDTPGHIDFSGEMERSLQVLDQAILVINSQDGIQNHTKTIWELLELYELPTFIFLNKQDITNLSKEELMKNIKQLSNNCVDFSLSKEELLEEIASCDEELLQEYLNSGTLEKESIKEAIYSRKVFPCFFGSALKDEGVVDLLDGLDEYSLEKQYPNELGFKVFKVAYDDNGSRLCYCKITGGELTSKQKLGEDIKIDQIRLIQGRKLTVTDKANAGMVVAIKGLEGYLPGKGYGIEPDSGLPLLEAYMNYQLIYPRDCDMNLLTRNLNILQDEDPTIQITYGEKKDIYVQLMGEIQIEIVQKVIYQRTGIKISLEDGKVLYKETIANAIEGVGHFEPLRHYAEVHVRLEPLEYNSGLEFASEVSSDILPMNYQNLILTHMQEKIHKGVLTGSPITDMRIVLIAGKHHLKHTEGGDFREATYRAIRQGLKKAQCILLEPYYQFVIDVSKEYLGSLLFDLETNGAIFKVEESNTGDSEIVGRGPIARLQNYQTTLLAKTKGTGKISFAYYGYLPCLNSGEVISRIGYDSELDFRNPTGSVFCAHGAGFYVPYDKVEEYMHLQGEEVREEKKNYNPTRISQGELEDITKHLGGRNKKVKTMVKKDTSVKKVKPIVRENREILYIADGYNIMYANEKLKKLGSIDLEGARNKVIDLLEDYAGYKGAKMMIVYDAYKVTENLGKSFERKNSTVIYTKAGQTADSYIEKYTFDHSKEYDIRVISSDGAVQNMILGAGAIRVSVREFEMELEKFKKDNL